MRDLLQSLLPALTTSATSWSAALLAASIKAAVVVALGAAIVAAMRHATAAARHLVWTLALGSALALPFVAVVVPEWRVAVATMPVAVAGPMVRASAPAAAAPAAAARAEETAPSASRAIEPEASVVAAPTPPSARGTWRDVASAVPPLGWAVALWLLGTLAVLARFGLSRRALARVRRSTPPVTDPSWIILAQRHARDLGITRPVTLLQSERACVPMTWGVIYPIVLLPVDAEAWSAARRSLVLLHELAHVKRLDALTQLVAQLATAVYWFNPLVWLAAARMRIERERACDDCVLSAGTRASAYARDLLDIARGVAAGTDRFAPAALAMARRSHLEARLRAILNPRLRRGAVGTGRATLTAVTHAALVVALAPMRPVVDAREASTTARLTGSPPADAYSVGSERPPTAPAAALSASAPTLSPTLAGPADRRGALQLVGRMANRASQPAAPVAFSAAAVPATTPMPTTAVVATARECTHRKGSHSHHSSTSRDGMKRMTISWSGDGCSVDVRSEGVIGFNSDFSDVASIGAGGFFELTERVDGQVRRLDIRERNGSLQRTYSVNGTAREWDDEGRAWLAGFLIELDRQTAFGADARFPRLYAEGGARGVLDEITRMRADYARGVYFRKLLAEGRLDAATARRAIQQAGREFSSDYELARTLMAIAANTELSDEGQRVAYLEAVDKLQSDYERARVLLTVLGKVELSRDVATSALAAASRLKSDYELSKVLVAVAGRKALDATLQQHYVQAAGSLESDYERSRSLRALLSAGDLDREAVLMLIRSAAAMKSDYEKARVLMAIPGEILAEDARARTAVLEAANEMTSRYERERVLSSLPRASSGRVRM